MRLIGFVDELVKLGTVRHVVVKLANLGENSLTQEPPPEMVGSDTYEPGDRVSPEEAQTRLPQTAALAKGVQKGRLGSITGPKEQIDKGKFNRPYEQ